MDYPKIDFTKMSCPPGLEFNKPYTLEEIKQAMRRELIDNSYIAEWTPGPKDKVQEQYAAYAKCDINKGDIVMECVIPFEWLTAYTRQMRHYRIRVEYDDVGVRHIMPLGNVLIMNYGRDEIDANCTVRIPEAADDRIITVIASQDIKKDDELRWQYRGQGDEI
tara:strand:+ start:310 stop:801 length:492 start_codon:yes stop_codon:yes gene_type:complete